MILGFSPFEPISIAAVKRQGKRFNQLSAYLIVPRRPRVSIEDHFVVSYIIVEILFQGRNSMD